MKVVLCVCFIYLLVGCRPSKPASRLSDYPDLNIDPLSYNLREKYRNAKKIGANDTGSLRPENRWNCLSVSTQRGVTNTINFTMEFFRQHGFLKVRSQTVEGGQDYFKVKVYAVTSLGLIGAGSGADKPYYVSWRTNSEGELLAEVYDAAEEKGLAPSLTRAKMFATSYKICSVGQNQRPDVINIPGACRLSDDEFNTEEGGCLDLRSGLVWSMTEGSPLQQTKAHEDCESLIDGGKDDWRLPLEQELVNLSQDNPARVPAHFYFEADRRYWTRDIGTAPYAWAVNLASGESHYVPKGGKGENNPASVCVREPLDTDKDHVPDTSDFCPETPESAKIATSGNFKGCSDAQVPTIVPTKAQ